LLTFGLRNEEPREEEHSEAEASEDQVCSKQKSLVS
jgi:hypothetical protein